MNHAISLNVASCKLSSQVYLMTKCQQQSDTYRIEPVAMFGVRGLNLGLGLHQLPNFVFAIR